MEASNISSEPFLKEEEEVQSQVEVTSSVGGDAEDPSDHKLVPSGTVSTQRRQAGDGDPSRTREESYMPRHHKSEVNPFVNRTMHLPWHQYVKMTIVGVTLLPLRLAFSLVNLMVMWAFASVVVMGLSEEAMQKPFNRCRLLFKYPICLCLRFQTFLFGFWWIRCKGKCADKSEAPIIVSNHVSPFEPIYLVGKTMATPVQRVEDSRVPIIGTIQKAMQRIEERSDPGSPFPQVMVFPEGTCTNQQALITFKHGPFVPGQPVQPVIVRYRYRWLDPSYPAVAPSLIALALRVLCQVWNCMEVEFLPVYEPTSEDRANPTLFAAHVQEIMCQGLGIPATQHAFEDVALQVHAMKMNLNPEVAVVEWSRMKESVDIDARTAKECLVMFSQMDLDRDGCLTLEEFCAHWKWKRNRLAEKQRRGARTSARDRARSVGEGDQLLGARRAHNRCASSGFPERGSPPGVEGGMSTEGDSALSSSTAHRDLEEAEQRESLSGASIHAGEGGGAGEGLWTGRRAGLASPKATSTSPSTPAEMGPGLEDECLELPGILRQDEIELAFDIFSGGGDLDFRRFLTGLGVLSGLSREGRVGLFKFIFTMLQGRNGEALSRIALERFIGRLRPDLSEANARELVDEAVREAGARKGSSEEMKSDGQEQAMPPPPQSISREEFLVFAESNGSLLSVYQAMLLNDILGAQRDITEFQLASDEHFGGVALDTSERSVASDELVATRNLSYL